MEFRLKSKDVNFVCAFAAIDADKRCTASLFKTFTQYFFNLLLAQKNYQQ